MFENKEVQILLANAGTGKTRRLIEEVSKELETRRPEELAFVTFTRKGAEEGSGTRSSLIFQERRMLEAKHPKYVMLENVKGLLSKSMRKYFLKYLKDLESFGYTSFYKVLDAKDYGVPQHRERIFVISILRTEDEPNPEYHFPSPIKLDTTVEDILEDNVSPEYFLSQPLLEKYLTKADINESIEKLYPEDSNTENC